MRIRLKMAHQLDLRLLPIEPLCQGLQDVGSILHARAVLPQQPAKDYFRVL